MIFNLPTTIEGGENREDHQIQTLNINNRKESNNNFNSFEINQILLSYHTFFSLVVIPITLHYHCPCL